MRPLKFNFIPERQLEEQSKTKDFFFSASITSSGQLHYNSEYRKVYELNEKYVEYYVDVSKRTLGWRILEDKVELEELNGARKLIETEKGQIIVSITKLLRLFAWSKGQSYLKLPIQIYKQDKMEIHYIKLPEVDFTLNGIPQ